MKLMIGIPAFNEESTLPTVLFGLPKKVGGITSIDCVVLDDGSTDGTSRIAEEKGAVVLTHLINRGLGGALKTLFAYARKSQYDLLVTFDADGQHEGKDIENMIRLLLTKQTDVVIGSRWLEKAAAPFLRKLVNSFANILTYFIFGIWSTDTQSGLRAFNKRAISTINLQSDGMEVSSEFFKEIYRNRLTVKEISIKPIYTDYSRKKGQKISNGPSVLFQLMVKFLK
jgi:glycosyltransferase involved in cell wall biosynthesis